MTHFKQSRESRVSPLRKCIRVCPVFFHVTHALSSTGNYKRELSALQSRRTLRRSSDKLVKASNNFFFTNQRRTKTSKSLQYTFIYIVSQVTPKIFFRFTIRAGLTNPKLNLSLFLFVPILFPMQLFYANIRGTKECQGMDGYKKSVRKKEDETTIFY